MQEDTPLVSVIMPAYNCEKFIFQAIESVLQQTYTNWELLVGDDGSTDNTQYIIDQFSDGRIIKSHNKSNQGNIRTRNRLFAEAKGEFLAVLDADDWMTEEKIEHQIEMFTNEKELDVCVTNYWTTNLDGSVRGVQAVEKDFYLKEGDFELAPRFHPASIMLKRSVFDEVGGLNLYFDRLFGEDIYWIYLIMERFKTLFVSKPLYYYRTNPASLTNDLDSERKLSVISLIEELIRQRRETGGDWLSRGQLDRAINFENNLLKQKQWLGEKYRIKAARSVDMRQFKLAFKYLGKAFTLNPYSVKNTRTLLYLIRYSLTQYPS